jgi:hypothetical protein
MKVDGTLPIELAANETLATSLIGRSKAPEPAKGTSSVSRLKAVDSLNSDGSFGSASTITGGSSVVDEADVCGSVDDDCWTCTMQAAQTQGLLTFMFDWDDTLMATSHMNAVLKDCSSKGMVAKLPAKACRRHAELVRRILVEARSLGNVVIVTTAKRPWVTSSAASYLPGIDFPALLQELNISVHYASEHQDANAKGCEAIGGVERNCSSQFTFHKSCKRNCFSKVLQSLYPDPISCRHVISIGDSLVERDAIKEALQYHWPHVCKTMKLMNSPSLKQLGNELDVLSTWLQSVAMYNGNLDMSFEDFERFPSKLSLT